MHRMHLDHIHSSRVSYSSSMSISPSVLSLLLLSPVSAAHMLMGIGPSTRAWATYGGHTLEENWLLPQQPSTASSSSAGVGLCEHTIHLVRAAMLTALIMCMLVETATAAVSSWVLTALPCLDHTVGGSPLWLRALHNLSVPFSMMLLERWGRWYAKKKMCYLCLGIPDCYIVVRLSPGAWVTNSAVVTSPETMTFSFLVALNCLSSPSQGGAPSPLIARCLLPSLVQALCGQLQLLWVHGSSGHFCLLRQFFMTFLCSHPALQLFPPLLGASQTLRGSDVVGICHVRLNICLLWAPWSAMILRISCLSL